MEESSLKAEFSRHEMEKTSEKARLVARNTLSGRCIVNCAEVPPDFPGQMMGMNPNSVLGHYIDDSQIFPQEVESIGDFMKDTYSTNINGFNARDSEYLNNNRLETESEGDITVEPLGSQEVSGNKIKTTNMRNNMRKSRGGQEGEQGGMGGMGGSSGGGMGGM